MKRICILGGSGFVGSHLVARMGEYAVRIVTRRPEAHRALRVLPHVTLVQADIHNIEQLTTAIADSDVLINLVGILNESGTDGEGFRRAHVRLAENLVTACKTNGIGRLLQMSALHADAGKGRSHYLRTKGEAEYILGMADHLTVRFFQPSVIFGQGDSFFNRFAAILRMTPRGGMIPVPCANTQFAPVWVEDVVSVILKTLETSTNTNAFYPLCGPKVYSHHQLWRYTAECLGLQRGFIPLNDTFSRFMAKSGDWAGYLLPEKPFSTDNYLSLQNDSVCVHNAFAALGINPTPLEVVVPHYLALGSQHQFDTWRTRAGRTGG